MRLYRDMSFKEIAENTNVSINTALGRMRYAIINLRKMINDYQIILESYTILLSFFRYNLKQFIWRKTTIKKN